MTSAESETCLPRCGLVATVPGTCRVGIHPHKLGGAVLSPRYQARYSGPANVQSENLLGEPQLCFENRIRGIVKRMLAWGYIPLFSWDGFHMSAGDVVASEVEVHRVQNGDWCERDMTSD
jgi:hypothetical protein